ncbi:MAG: hypothetical protein HY336_01995 [Candidatus Doudnabacteria bacterium]|nr:hypothetical protein [Candidatus Doudnabacteria bacterium]
MLMTKPVAKPEEAVEQLIGEQFTEWLMEYIFLKIHDEPEMSLIKTAKPKIEKLRKFLLQLFLTDEAFVGGAEGDPGFLRFAIANLSESNDPQAEGALNILEKRRQEELLGHKVEKGIIWTRSRELWIKLFKALGLTPEEVNRTESKEWTRNYISEISDLLSNADWQVAAGVFTVFERAIPEEYKAVINLLRNNSQISDQDLEVLTKRVNMYDQYAKESMHILEKIVFDPQSKQLIWEGVSKHLEARREFYSGNIKYLEATT